MSETFAQLPWEDLRRMEGDIPWPALEAFAAAVVGDSDLARELFAEYDRAWQAVEVPTYLDLYVPAIFTLAAPKLGGEQRRQIGDFLVDKLLEAGREGGELAEEALLAASGSMGPVILPKVLDTLATTADHAESVAWSMCWSLTALAAQTEDAALRDRTVRACVPLLEQIERGEVEEFIGISAAWTLALLKYTDAIPLLQRLGENCDNFSGGADYREAAAFLLGPSDRPLYKEAWEHPVRQWLECWWQMARRWYGRQDSASSAQARETSVLEQRAYESPAPTPITPPIPIVEHAPKTGRNDPCPCGSGKKYKKCCGAPAQGQAARIEQGQ